MATRSHTVAKITISLPRDVLKEVDRTAREQMISRSSLIHRAILVSLRKYRDAEITRQVNRALRNPKARKAMEKEMTEWDDVSHEWMKDWTW
jgi:metal-responsive CopG/Arc/MetJ family transcriptional regulator